MTQAELIVALEALVDKSSITEVASCLGLVCFEKAEHVLINWQDKALAKTWERNGKKLMSCYDKLQPTA